MLEGELGQDERLAVDGVPAVDPTHRYYVGGSQGGIYGATYMSITPDMAVAMSNVPVIPLHHQVVAWAMRSDLAYVARTDEFTFAHLFKPR